MASVCELGSEIPEKNLSETFQDGWKMVKDIENSLEPSTNEKYQESVKKAISLLEAATRSVSKLSLFSLNEEFDEVATSDVKYILLPCLLGNLSGKLTSVARPEVLSVMEIYYKNFLTLCKSYNVSKFNFNSDVNTDEAVVPSKPTVEDLSRKREEKIKRYRERKEFEELINQMEIKIKINTTENIDEELQRNYYVTLLKFYINSSLEELENIQMEKSILNQMKKTKDEKFVDKNQSETHKPMKPFIITRTKLEKQIFGLGYPSISTMTIDEFYEQRLKTAPVSNEQDTTSLMTTAMMGLDRRALQEEDAIKAEIEAETEDVEAIEKQRAFDDWKDDNRRGCGNRKNMG